MKKILKLLSLCIVSAISCFIFVGCDITEINKNVESTIESATSLVPIEYSEELAKNVYLTSINNSKKQTTVKLQLETTQLLSGSIISSSHTMKAYWRNSNDKTDFVMDINGDGEHLIYTTKIDNNYYTFDTTSHQYRVGTSGIEGGEGAFALVNDVYGGLCYGDAVSKIMAKNGNTYISINIKNSLVVGFDSTNYDENLLVNVINNGTYEYNTDLSDIFEGLPTSLNGWTLNA